MAAKSDSLELPEHWVLRKSCRLPSMIYYFNTKTGRSSWLHPSLIKKGSPQFSSESMEKKTSRKRALKDKEMSPKRKAARDKLEKNEADSRTPSESSPSHKESKIDKLEDSLAEAEKNWSNREPVTFVINKKVNVLGMKKSVSSIKRTAVPVHPNLLKVRKIAERVKWSKKKDVNAGAASVKEVPKAPYAGAASVKAVPEAPYAGAASVNAVPEAPYGGAASVKAVPEAPLKGKTLKAMRTKKNKDDEDLIRNIIKEISSSPKREEESVKLSAKDKKVVRRSKNEDYDVYKRFLKSREESPPKQHSLSAGPSKRVRAPPLAKTAPEQTPLDVSNAEVEHDEVTEMEVEEHEIISEIANFRGSVSYSKEAESDRLLTSTIDSNSNSVYVVVDTNVLIQDIGFLERLKGEKIAGKEVVIVIPYTALQEMDGLKKKESIGKACQTAIRWCNGHFEKSDPRVQGQSYDNFLKTVAENQGSGADDLIRDCCLLLKKEGLEVCLLTNDVNLRNKTLMASVHAVGVRPLKLMLEEESTVSDDTPKEPDSRMHDSSGSGFDARDGDNKRASENPELEKMVCDTTPRHHKRYLWPRQQSEQKLLRKNVKLKDHGSEDESLLRGISNSLHHTLGKILEHIMKDTYEDVWLKIIKHKPPWNITEVFSCWEKHWIAVMNDRFPRELKVHLSQVKDSLDNCKRGRGNVATLREKVEILYKFFKCKPYCYYTLPISVQPSQTVISEVSVLPSSDGVIDSDTVERLTDNRKESTTEQTGPSGIANIENMINLVGLHITQFIALILDAFNVEHNIPSPNSLIKMTREDAGISGINLHKVTMRLGNAIVRCLTETTSDSLQELGNLLVNFWAEAKEPCPNLPFTEEGLAQYVTSSNGQHFLKLTLGELEKLLTTLMPVIESR